jgi:glycosyltransferase involved in cell wall biosynthesis
MRAELTIDARWLRTGIGRYTQSLLDGVRRNLQPSSEAGGDSGLPEVRISCIAQARDLPRVEKLVDRVTLCDAGIYGLHEQLAVPWHARKADALYAPHYNIPLLWQGRLLVTIHDLTHLLSQSYARTRRSRWYARPMLRRAAERADVIVTPSEYTARCLEAEFAVERSRIRVIPCCVAPCFTFRDKQEARYQVSRNPGIQQPFVLFVGNGSANKNLQLLLKALGQLRERRADTPMLVVAGTAGPPQPGVVWMNKLPDAILADLYSAALMTVMPSFEEGFGLPVIESMACGTPVLCSRSASLPEVGGNAALYFSPYSSEELASKMESVLDSSSLEKQLIEAGLERATSFSRKDFWRRQAAAIRAVLGEKEAIPFPSSSRALEVERCVANAQE